MRLWPFSDYSAPHGAECDGTVSDPADGVCRTGDPCRGDALLSRPRRTGAGPGLGPDAAGWGRGIRLDSTVDRDLSGPRDRPHRLRLQPLWRCPTRRPRPQTARPLSDECQTLV